MKSENAVQCLAALGHLHRLQLFQLLVRAGNEGVSIGEIQRGLEIPASTLSFHMRELTTARLVTQRKEGRTVLCHANFSILNDVLTFLKQDCCRGVTLPIFALKS
ncbi:MAG: helix-turn-helix transcriptional regulator [Ramlibacter sp.]|nr:helix-turn-helix transcriptional regulator [Ramlibacter sp.]